MYVDDNNKNTIDRLILNSDKLTNPGLLNGKMGIAILFYHLSRKKESSLYSNVADQIIDSIVKTIDLSIPLDFENGLLGIAWGFAYLIDEKFLDSQNENILSDFDDLIYDSGLEIVENLPIDLDLGITGYMLYSLKRIKKYNGLHNKPNQKFRELLRIIIKRIHAYSMDMDYFLFKEEKIFMFNWNYALILNLLKNAYSIDEFKNEISSIIYEMVSPTIKGLRSKSVLNYLRLLTELYCINNFLQKNDLNTFLKKEMQVLSKLDIKKYIPADQSLATGSTGISFVLYWLHIYSKQHIFLEMHKIVKSTIDTNSPFLSSSLLSSNKNKFELNYGLYNGIAGYIWLNEICELPIVPF